MYKLDIKSVVNTDGLLGPLSPVLQGDDEGIFIVDGLLSLHVDAFEYKPEPGTSTVSLPLPVESWVRCS